MANRRPNLPNLEAFYAIGMDPRTGLPLKFDLGNKKALKQNIKIQLRALIDEPDAVNRYVWYNLPCDLTSQELERMIYYRGQLCFFYDKDLEQFFFAPYALKGTIDCYGRYNYISPVPFTNGSEDKDSNKNTPINDYFSKKTLKCVYGVKTEVELEDMYNSTVLLHDYTKQLSQNVIPRAQINDGLLDAMADCIPFMHTSLMLGTGVKGIRVQEDDQAASVGEASRALENAALTGDPFVPVIGNIDFQELVDGQVNKSEEYMLAMQSLNNFRLETYGLPNNGLFEKKAHVLESEQAANGAMLGLPMVDGLQIRQHFCNVVNSIWGLGIWCEPAESVTGADLNGDNLGYDRDEAGENGGVETGGGEANE